MRFVDHRTFRGSKGKALHGALSVALSFALGAGPAAQAATEPYFRFPSTVPVAPGKGADGGPEAGTNNPPPKPGVVRGTGDLALYAPIQVRARIGVDFRLRFDATNAVGGINWSSAAGSLPDGLSVSPDGVLQGRPTRVMSVPGAMLHAVDGSGKTGDTQPFAIDVEPLPVVTTDTRYDVPAGEALTVAPGASHVFGSSSWSVAGDLPPGIRLDQGSGRLSGVPERRGTYPDIVLTVLDSDGATGRSRPFTIVADGRMAVSGIQPTYAARTGRGMAAIRPMLSGAANPVLWSLSGDSKALPAGLDVNPETGVVSGIPAVAGSFPGLLVRAQDMTTNERAAGPPFLIRIGGMPAIAAGDRYVARAGETFTASPTASDILGAAAWTYDGSLPAGLDLDPSLGTIGGRLAAPGTASGIVLRVTDLFDGATAESAPLSIQVWPALRLSVPDAAPATVGASHRIPPPAVSGLVGAPAWSVAGEMPPGLSFDKSDGSISGTPGKAGSYALTYEVRDGADGARATASVQVAVSGVPGPLSIGPMLARYPSTVGRPFEIRPVATGATGPLEWTVAGSLPTWAGFDLSSGRISGTPDLPGATEGLTVTVSDGRSTASSKPFAVDVAPGQPLEVSVPATISSTEGVRLDGPSPTVLGSVGGNAFSLAMGALPQGLSLSGQSGILSGTPLGMGTYGGLSLTVRDASGAVATSNPFSVTVKPSRTDVSVSIQDLTGVVGEPLSGTPTSAGLSAPLTWSLAAGSLPAWAGGVDAVTGAIHGVPTATGTWGGLALDVADAAGRSLRTEPFALRVVDAPALSVSMADIEGTVTRSLKGDPRARTHRGGLSWTLVSGVLPTGFALDPTTGTIAGSAPAATEASGLVLRAVDASGASADTRPFAVRVTRPALSAAMPGTAHRMTAGAAASLPAPSLTGLVGTATWSSAGKLPDGVTVAAGTGILSGTPTSPGGHPGIVLTATDSFDGRPASTQVFTVTVDRPDLVVTNGAGPYVGRAGSDLATDAPTATGLLGTLSWQARGTLPAGMSVRPGTGIVAGVPTVPGTYADIRPEARDGFDGTVSTGTAMTIRVLGQPVAAMASRQVRTGAAFSASPSASEVKAPLRWTLVQGERPSWLSLDEASGTLSGTSPAPVSLDGLVLRVTDALGGTGDTTPFSIVAVDATPEGLSARAIQASYAARVTKAFETKAPLAGGATGAVTWSLASGSPPAWARIAPGSGVLSGTPDVPGTFDFALRANEAGGATADTLAATVSVTPAPEISVAGDHAVRVGAPFVIAPAVAHAVGAQSWSRISGTLPPWATLTAGTGRISGTPDAVGAFPGIVLSVTDSDLVSGRSGPLSITVSPGIAIADLPASRTLRRTAAVGGIAPRAANAIGAVAWSAAGLPQGMSVDPSTGAFTGSPAASGTFPVTVTAVDASDKASASAAIALTVIPEIVLTGPGPVAGHTNADLVSRAPGVSGQRGTMSWSLASGTLPSWLELDADLGMLRGRAPGVTRVAGIALKATDSFDQATGVTEPFDVDVLGPLGVADMATNYTARVGFAFVSTPPTLRNAVGAVRWAWGPNATRPDWLALDAATGIMTGTPGPKVATPNLALVGTDASGLSASSIAFQMNVLDEPAVILPETAVTTRVGRSVALNPRTTGMSGTARWSVANLVGTMPDGLSVDPATGAFGGTAAGPGKATFVLRVADGADAHTADSGSITVEANPGVEVAGLAAAYRGHAGARLDTATPQALNALGAVTWTSSLPAPGGLELARDGRLGGVPETGLAKVAVTLTATDAFDGATGTATYELEILPAISAEAKGDLRLRSGADASLASLLPAATNAFSPADVRWTLAAGILPSGLTVDERTGRIVGNAPNVATLAEAPGIRLRATDGDGTRALTDPFVVSVAPPLSVAGIAADQTATETLDFALQPSPVNLIGQAGWTVTGLVGGLGAGSATGLVSGSPGQGTGRVTPYEVRLTLRDDWDGATKVAPFRLTVIPADPVPDAFAFQDVANATGGARVASQPVRLTGMTTPGALSLNVGGAFPVRVGIDGATPSTDIPPAVPPNASLVLSLDAAPGTDGGTRVVHVTVGGVPATWRVATSDTTPDAVAIADALDVAANAVVVSNTATVRGITGPTPVGVSGEGNPQVSIAGGPWVTSGTVSNLQSVQLRLTAAETENGTFRSASLDVGGVVSGWNVSTRDTSPSPYALAALVAQPLGTLVVGAPTTITGISSAAPVSVSGAGSPMVRVGGASGAWGTTATVVDGQTVEIRLTTPTTEATARSAILNVGGVSQTWTVTTGVATPAPFSFAPVANAPVSSAATSASVTLSGATLPGTLSVTAGGAYQVRLGINGAAPSATIPSTVPAKASLVLSLDTPASPDGTARTATVSVNGVQATWTVTAVDTQPNLFGFTSVQGQALNAVVASEPATITGITAASPVTVSGTGGPEVSVNGGAWTAGPTTILGGQTLSVRLTSASSSLSDRTAVVTVGGLSAAYTVRTLGTDTSPDAFAVSDVGGIEPGGLVVSGAVLPTGFDAPVTLSASGAAGSPQVSINGGAWVASATLYPAQSFRVRATGGTFGQVRDFAVALGNRSDTWTLTTRQQDSAPDAFAFQNLTGQPGTSLVTSASVTPSGYRDAAPVSVTGAGAQVSVNGGAWGTSGTITPGQPIQVRLTTGIPDGVTSQATVTIGGISANWSATTIDTMPDARTFPTITEIPPSATDFLAVTERAVLLTGFTSPAYYDVCATTETYVRYAGVLEWRCSGYINPGEVIAFVAYGGDKAGTTVTRTFSVGGRQYQLNVQTKASDPDPWNFTFDSIAGTNPGQVYTSNAIVPIEYYSAAPVRSLSAGVTFDINGSGSFASSGEILPGQSIRLRMAAPAAGTQSCVQVAIGGIGNSPWCLTSAPADTLPTVVTIPDSTSGPSMWVNAGLSSTVWPNTYAWGQAIGGFNAPTTLTVEGTLNGVAYGNVVLSLTTQDGSGWYVTGRLNPGQAFTPILFSGANPGDRVDYVLKANGITFLRWGVVTEGSLDTVPDAFSVPALTAQAGNALVESQAVVPQNYTNPAAVSVSGGGAQVSINGGAWVTSGTISPGQPLKLRLTTGTANGGSTSATVTVGGVSATWSVTTSNLTPTAFSFPATTGADPSVFVASGSITVAGLGTQATATASGGHVTVNGGGLATTATVRNGDVLQLFATTGSAYGTSQAVTLTVGAGAATWSITTRTQDATPGAFAIPAMKDQAPDSVTTSAPVTPVAYLDAAAISATGEGTPEVSVDGGAWAASGTISPGKAFQVRLRSSATAGGVRTGKVSVGGVTADFAVTTR
jgi:hypothetical protein